MHVTQFHSLIIIARTFTWYLLQQTKSSLSEEQDDNKEDEDDDDADDDDDDDVDLSTYDLVASDDDKPAVG